MIEVLPIDFMGQPPLLEPVDQSLHDMAVDYCQRELQGGSEINFAKFTKVWVVREDEEIVGIAGFVWRLDVPVFRVTGKHADRATAALVDRIRGHFQDIGARGMEAFVHISSKERPEQRCDKWQESLSRIGAVPADRFTVKI